MQGTEFGALANNGEPTQTHALIVGSTAIDAGTCVNALDQRGYLRPAGATCNIGAYEYNAVVADTIPAAFSFTAQTGVALFTPATSNIITVSGINAATPISIAGGTYSINGGAYTSVAGTVSNGNTVAVRLTASASFSTLTTATLTIGGVSGAFAVTTLAADTTPNAFSFTAQTGVALSTVATSNTITVAGINSAANISIAGGTYSINGGAYTAVTGTANNGDTVTVKQTSSAGYSILTTATLTIGGVSGAFNVTTLAATTSYTAPSAIGTGNITASFTGGGAGCGYTAAQFIPLTGHAASPPSGSAPAGVSFPQGLFDFTTGGCTAGSTITLTITYPQALPAGTQYWKYGPTPGNAVPHWYVLPATIAGNTATFSITDGGLGDDDLAANGTIVDQGGPGVPGGGGAASIPTLSEWGLILLAGMLGVFGMVGVRRNKSPVSLGAWCAAYLAAAVLLSFATPALAATNSWLGLGDTAGAKLWSGIEPGDWSETTPPANGDDVVLNGNGPSHPSTYDLNRTLNSITLNTPVWVATPGWTIANGGGFVLGLQSGGFITDNNTRGPDTLNTGVTLNGPATFTLSAGAIGLSFGTAAITGTGPLTLVNNSTDNALQLNFANTYTGATTINGTDRVFLDVNGAIPTGSALTVNGSALFNANADSTIGSLAGGGNVFLNGNNTLSVGGDNTSTTFSGVYQDVNGSAALTKSGSGTFTLSGVNTYTGATTINGGVLAVNGSLASPVTVNAGGTLGGTGAIGNTVTVNSGGALAPGLSPGIINTGDLALTSGSTLAIEINGATAGTQYDQVNVTGTVDLGGATLGVTLGYTPSVATVFVIVNNDGAANAITGTFAGLAEGATFAVGAITFRISYTGGDGNDVTLTVMDTTPDAFGFTAQTGVARSTQITSAPAQIGGINMATSWTATGGTACVSSGNDCACDVSAYAASGSVSNNQYMCARQTSSASFSATTTATLTIGGVSGAFAVTTLAVTTSYTAPSATGTGNIAASFTGGAGCGYTVAQFIPLTGHAASPPAGSAPAGVSFPHGLFDFTAAGCLMQGATLAFTITYPQALPAGTQYWKYGPTPGNAVPHWYVLPATIAGNTATFSITDGGLGDDDLAANGTIVDQGGQGVPGGGAASIPTLSEWGLILLAGLMGLLGMGAMRRGDAAY